jgi:site-specific recombinase
MGLADHSPETIRSQVLECFPPAERGDGLAAQLADRLSAIALAASLERRLDALVELVEWTRRGEMDIDPEDPLAGRARLLAALHALNASPAARRAFQELCAEIVWETEAVGLFGDTGIPGDRGFIAELTDRILRRLLPEPSDTFDLSRLITRLYSTRKAVERLQHLPPEIFERLVELVVPADQSARWKPLRTAFAEGFRLLAVRVQGQGLSRKLRERGRAKSIGEAPFYRLALASDTLVQAWQAGTADFGAILRRWRQTAQACRSELQEIRRRLEGEGVSVDVVYGIDVIERCLERMEVMVEIMSAANPQSRAQAIHRLLVRLTVLAHQDRSPRHLLRESLQMLQRKIVERSGKTGEHYVARSLREYRHIWLAAAGGGLLTVATAAVKLEVTHAGLPLFVEGLAAGLNYALSFMLLHHFHLILATKQPAMTAAALATLLRVRDRTERLDRVVEYTVHICCSQFAAAVANVAVVFGGAFLFNFFWRLALGRNYLDGEAARHVFQTLSPVDSGTVFYAAFTGALLYAAAMIGGWLDNWAAWHRLPQAIADHALGRRLGRSRMVRLAGVVSRNAAGWGTNISLGFLLGLTPVFGQFLGLPLDVRHVTLSSGMLAFACAGLDGWFTTGWFFWALAGVGTMFVLNLSVSFGLSLYTAARAYDLDRRELGVLGARLLRRLTTRPLDFFLPRAFPREEERAEEARLEKPLHRETERPADRRP